MSSSKSHFTINPLYSQGKYNLPQKSPELIAKLIYDEIEVTSRVPQPSVYELIYYEKKDYKSLPTNGWIKPCVRCYERTGQTIIYANPRGTRYQYIRLHICKQCRNITNDNMLKKCKRFVGYYLKTQKYFKSLNIL